LTCTGVSFAHGSNDGQKGQGLVVLILVGILPGAFALRMDATAENLHKISASAHAIAAQYYPQAVAAEATDKVDSQTLSDFLKSDGVWDDKSAAAFASLNLTVANRLGSIKSLDEIAKADRSAVRSNIYLVGETIGKLLKGRKISDPAEAGAFKAYKKQLDGLTKYIPDWVKVAVAISLGFGTMIGWKRIVVTVGEKIGKEHLTYAQGASAELIAMGTIFAADNFGLPVSTTHVLSSGIAGTMAANGSGLQKETLRNILLAWVLTLPVCVFLGASLFAFAINVILHGALH
jgi:PiT family inorganic phosphate transporter